jgi:hypothetical protein
MIALLLLSGGSLVAAQCYQDLLVDDFSRNRIIFFDGADRLVNLLDADYGTESPLTTMTVDTRARTMTVVPGTAEAFFFAKYNQLACFDLTRYTAFEFELEAPANAEAAFTLTQSNRQCTARVEPGDSVYHPLSRYYTPGRRQLVRLPFSDFAINVLGGPFDMEHLKDWTMVSMKPIGARFVFRNMRLIGNRAGCSRTSTTTSSRTTTTTTTTSSRTTTSTCTTTTTSLVHTVVPSVSSANTGSGYSQATPTTTAAARTSTADQPSSSATPEIKNSGSQSQFSWGALFAAAVPLFYILYG